MKQRYKHHKLHKILFFAFLFIPTLLLFLEFAFYDTVNASFTALMCIAVFFSVIWFFAVSIQESNDALKILNDLCDPDGYADVVKKYLLCRGHEDAQTVHRLNMYLGIFYSGRFDESIALMNAEIYGTSFKKIPLGLRVHTMINQCSFMLVGGRSIEEVETILSEIREFSGKMRDRQIKSFKIDERIKDLEYEISFAKGNYEGYEEFYLMKFNNATCAMQKAITSYYLYRYYNVVKNKKEAVRFAQISCDTANKLYFKDEVEGYLSSAAGCDDLE